MIKKAMKYAVGCKKELYLAILMIFLSVIAGILPYLAVNKLIVSFLEESTFSVKTIIYTGVLIAFFLILKSGLNAVGITLSHKAAYGTL
ncbi:MAG: hypothetical protein QM697_15765 [Lachnospiraceae bacterium]